MISPVKMRAFIHISSGIILSAVAQLVNAGDVSMRYLMSLSLEELAKVKVTSVSRRSEEIREAAASIYVITGNEIRRSGVTTLPDALRLAPNLHVTRAGAGDYGISARGFNDLLGNKLLVLVDGRAIYSPVFSGVFWQSQEVLLEDVERIEVISGPAGTLWGLNAVNGVINVVTRAAENSRAPLINVGTGNEERSLSARVGGSLQDGADYRVYAKRVERDQTRRIDGTMAQDAFDRQQAGFRVDWDQATEFFTLQGDVFEGQVDQTNEPEFSGGNLLARWTHRLGADADLRVQAYYDLAKRDNFGVLPDEMKIADIEVQHQWLWGDMHQIVWGGGYREAKDKADNSNGIILFFPEQRDLRWSNVFLQDTISLAPTVQVTPGVKWERNVYTGTEFLPSVRAAWQPDLDLMYWGAMSRVVRAPARIDRDFYLTLIPGSDIYLIDGGRTFESEISDVFELGVRGQPSTSFTYSVTAFYQEYDKLRSGEPSPQPGVFPSFVVSNTIKGEIKGLEAWANCMVSPHWRLTAGLIELRKTLENEPGSRDPEGPRVLGNDPHHTLSLRSLYNINERYEFDVMLRHVSDLPDPELEAYTAVDLRLGAHVSPSTELAFVVQNAFDPEHAEFVARQTPSEIRRAFSVSVRWQPIR